jgi:hypothetical protein
MATAGTGFAAGLRTGGGLVSQALENERLDEAAARQAQEFERKKVGWQREDTEYGLKMNQRAELASAAGGIIDPEQVPKIGAAFGDTPEQVQRAQAQPGGAAALYKTYEDSQAAADAIDRQRGLPVAPREAPPVTAQAIQTRPATAADYEKINMRHAAQRGDVEGLRTATAAHRTADITDTTDNAVKEFMAMPEAERVSRAYSPNLTGDIPMVTLDHDKHGMTVIPLDPKTGQPKGEAIKLSWADASQLHAAEQIAKKGYGAEAIDMATKVNARIGESIKAHNELMGKVQTGNNDAAYKGGMLANDTERLSLSREELGLKKDAAARENSKPYAADDTGYISINSKTHLPSFTPWPEGTSAAQRTIAAQAINPKSEWKPLGTDGSITDGKVIMKPNDNYNKDPTKVKGDMVNTTDPYINATPGRGGDGASALKAFRESRDMGPPRSAAGLTTPGGPATPAAPAPPGMPPPPAVGLAPPDARPLVQGQGANDQFNQQLQERHRQQVAVQQAVRQDPDAVKLFQQFQQASNGRAQAVARSQLDRLVRQRYGVSLDQAGI